ncbi:uncharacterized protein LOC135146314 [Zophobas morio]|uniref:uncharacterized protein LOC135146314 n=1 Tax=Zophobas morio TaxID=2755281 RepID=UPI0030836B59
MSRGGTAYIRPTTSHMLSMCPRLVPEQMAANDREGRFALLTLGALSGEVTFWRFVVPYIDRKSCPLVFRHKARSERVTALAWLPSTSESLMAVGYVDGAVELWYLRASEDSEFVVERLMLHDADRRHPIHFEWRISEALEWQIAVSKGLDLYVHIRGKTFHVARKSMYISGMKWLSNDELLVSSLDESLVLYCFQPSDEKFLKKIVVLPEKTTTVLERRLSERGIFGLEVSPNRAFVTLTMRTQKLFKWWTVVRTFALSSSIVVIENIKSTLTELQSDTSAYLDTLWDSLESLRCSASMHATDYIEVDEVRNTSQPPVLGKQEYMTAINAAIAVFKERARASSRGLFLLYTKLELLFSMLIKCKLCAETDAVRFRIDELEKFLLHNQLYTNLQSLHTHFGSVQTINENDESYFSLLVAIHISFFSTTNDELGRRTHSAVLAGAQRLQADLRSGATYAPLLKILKSWPLSLLDKEKAMALIGPQTKETCAICHSEIPLSSLYCEICPSGHVWDAASVL